MEREVNEIVSDRHEAKKFLENIDTIKYNRKKRNIQAMIANSTNPNKNEVDFVLENMYLNQGSNDFKEEQKMRAMQVKQERQSVAQYKKKTMLEQKANYRILQMFRWDLIKEKKAEAIEGALEWKRVSLCMRRWVKLMLSHAIIEQIRNNYHDYMQRKLLF